MIGYSFTSKITPAFETYPGSRLTLQTLMKQIQEHSNSNQPFVDHTKFCPTWGYILQHSA